MTWVWDIHPILVSFGSVEIRYYGVLFATGLLIASTVAGRFFRMKDYPEEDLSTLTIWIIVGLILGAHWIHLIFYEPHSILHNPIRIVQFGSGLASHGGGIGVALAVLWLCRKWDIPFYRYADPIAAAAMWIVPTVRLGNFFNSEIYGRATDGSWGVIFARRGFDYPRHPSQLYEAALGLAIVLFAMWFYKKYHNKFREGTTVYVVLGLYFLTRFGIEWFKEYQILAENFPLTMGQLLSLPITLLCAYQVFFSRKFSIFKPPSEEEMAAQIDAQQATARARNGYYEARHKEALKKKKR